MSKKSLSEERDSRDQSQQTLSQHSPLDKERERCIKLLRTKLVLLSLATHLVLRGVPFLGCPLIMIGFKHIKAN